MARRVALNIIGEAYSDETLGFAQQEAINNEFIPAETEGARNAGKQRGTPGLTTFGTVGVGAWRGGIKMAGVPYVVMDTTLYSVASNGVGTSLGTIEGSGRVGIAENGIQLVVVNGTKGWVYNRNTAVFAQITDVDFAGADDCFFIKQYIVFVRRGSDEFQWSDLGDATSIGPTSFAASESATDNHMGGLPLNGEAWFFGEESIEVNVVTDAVGVFEVRSVIEKGLAATFAKASLDNTVYWLGNNGIVYRAQGYAAVRVSKRPIEQDIADQDMSTAFAFAYEEAGNAYFVLTFPAGKTWVYNVATNRWHRRKSFEMSRWRANGYIYAYNKHLIGDFANGKVWELDRGTYTEGDDPLVWERKSQYIHADGEYLRAAELELEFETGVGLATGQGSAPIVDMCYSDDGGRNFKTWRQGSLGAMGEYENRVRFHGLGRFRKRIFWTRISDPVKRDLIAASGKAAD